MNQVVQEPEILPKWVEEIDAVYLEVAEHFVRSAAIYQRANSIGLTSIPINNHYSDVNKFMDAVTEHVISECEKHFAPAGTKLDINPKDIPQELYPKITFLGKNWDFNPTDFKPSKIYQILEQKYAYGDKAENLASAQAATTIVLALAGTSIRYNTISFVRMDAYHNDDGTVKPFIERFDVVQKKTKKHVIYQLTMVPDDCRSNITGVQWKNTSISEARKLFGAMENVFKILDHGSEVSYPSTVLFSEMVADLDAELSNINSGGQFAYGFTETFGPNDEIAYVLRKNQLDIRVSHTMHQRLLGFINKHYIVKPEHI